MNRCIPNEQVGGASDKEKFPKMTWERNLDSNQTQKGTYPYLGYTG